MRSRLPMQTWLAKNNQTCPSNENWNECGTACPPTCDNPKPTVCTTQCVQGCQCNSGLVRNKSGQCIPPNWCPNGNQTCSPNENWNECGTACPPTCDNPKPTFCTEQCVQGCQCKPGLVRNKWGQCVLEHWCPNGNQTCPPHEEWNECGTACPPTCKNPNPEVCTLQCVRGCQCKPGLLRNKWGFCVPRRWCCA
ncbi:serine protease inhibitor swm-1-like [Lasioglossum baleicum]|uniref:serine protease inhibitor swm-1-like n=1 Tax=Lasioglossum baleicum TaxID=434251 RepID=UPI003FCD9885